MRLRKTAFLLPIAALVLGLACAPAAAPTPVPPKAAPTPTTAPAAPAAVAPTKAPAPTAAAPTRIPKVGVLVFVSHPAFDDALKGAIAALKEAGFEDGKTIQLDIQNAQADIPTVGTIAQRFKDAAADVILALGTPPAQAAYKVSQADGKPAVVFSMVVDPYGAGLAKSPTDHPAHVTGSQTWVPRDKNLEAILEVVPQAKKVGTAYNKGEQNSVVDAQEMRKVVEQRKLEFLETSVTRPDEVGMAYESLVARGADILYQGTDSTVGAALAAVTKVQNERKVPVISAGAAMASEGPLLAVGSDFVDLGRISGTMIAKYLKGASLKDMPIQKGEKEDIGINLRSMQLGGFKIPDSLMNRATMKFTEIKGR